MCNWKCTMKNIYTQASDLSSDHATLKAEAVNISLWTSKANLNADVITAGLIWKNIKKIHHLLFTIFQKPIITEQLLCTPHDVHVHGKGY